MTYIRMIKIDILKKIIIFITNTVFINILLTSPISADYTVTKSADGIKIKCDLLLRIDDKFDELIKLKQDGKLLLKDGSELQIPDGNCTIEFLHYQNPLLEKIVDIAEKKVIKNYDDAKEKINNINKLTIKEFKKCQKLNFYCKKQSLENLGKYYNSVKKDFIESLEDIKHDFNKIKNPDNLTEDELKKLIEQEKLTINELKDAYNKHTRAMRWKIFKSTFSVIKNATTLSLDLADLDAWKSVVSNIYTIAKTLKEGYGKLKSHIEIMNMNIGALKYATEPDNIREALYNVEESTRNVKSTLYKINNDQIKKLYEIVLHLRDMMNKIEAGINKLENGNEKRKKLAQFNSNKAIIENYIKDLNELAMDPMSYEGIKLLFKGSKHVSQKKYAKTGKKAVELFISEGGTINDDKGRTDDRYILEEGIDVYIERKREVMEEAQSKEGKYFWILSKKTCKVCDDKIQSIQNFVKSVQNIYEMATGEVLKNPFE